MQSASGRCTFSCSTLAWTIVSQLPTTTKDASRPTKRTTPPHHRPTMRAAAFRLPCSQSSNRCASEQSRTSRVCGTERLESAQDGAVDLDGQLLDPLGQLPRQIGELGILLEQLEHPLRVLSRQPLALLARLGK